MSFWDLVYRAAYYPANIKRIEEGRLKPGVQFAFRLLNAIGVDPGALWRLLPANMAPIFRKTSPVGSV